MPLESLDGRQGCCGSHSGIALPAPACGLSCCFCLGSSCQQKRPPLPCPGMPHHGPPTTAATVAPPPLLPALQLLTWQLPWGGMAPFKIMQAVLAGERPAVPPLEDLPGPDTADFAGLDSYMELMG